MSNKTFLALLFICAFVIFINCGKGIAQSFQALYGSSLQFGGPAKGSILLMPAATARLGLSTVTIPDITGTLITTASVGIASTTIACWTANGQIGKCTTSISGVLCSTCT